MFLGEFIQTIDPDSRLSLPDQFLARLVGEMIVTRGFDHSLMVFEPNQWQLLVNKILAQPLSFYQSRNLRRRFFSGAAVLRIDDSNRIPLPNKLREFADLGGEVVLAGMYDFFEIWNFQTWQTVRHRATENNNGAFWEVNGV